MSGSAQRMILAVLAMLAAVAGGPGCRRAKAPAAPLAPVAVASAEPLSIPQTAVYLPPWQPVPPGAVPPEPEPEPEPPVAPPASPVTERPVAPPPTRPRPSPPAAQPAQPAPPPAAARPVPGSGGQLRPLLSAEQEQDLQRRLDRSLAAAERVLAQTAPAPRRRNEVERVRSFIEQAQQARKQGDLVRAASLAERAEVLAAGLTSIR